MPNGKGTKVSAEPTPRRGFVRICLGQVSVAMLATDAEDFAREILAAAAASVHDRERNLDERPGRDLGPRVDRGADDR